MDLTLWHKSRMEAFVSHDHSRNQDIIPEYLHEEVPLPSVRKSSEEEDITDSSDNGAILFSTTKQTTV